MKKVIWPLVIVLVAIGIFWVMTITRPEAPVVENQEKKWLVDAIPAKFETVAPEVTLYGRIETPRDAELKSALAADVAEVHVYEGMHVVAGQLLITLDDIDIRLNVQQRQADIDEISAQIESEKQSFQRDLSLLKHQQALLEIAERAVERASKLQQNKLASQAHLDEAKATKEQQLLNLVQLQHSIDEHPSRLSQLKAKYARAEALLELAQVDLARTEIKAPFEGRIAKLNVAVGDRLRVGDELISVYDLAHLEVRSQIPGRYVAEIKSLLVQQKPLIASGVVDGQKLKFELVRLSGEVRADSGGIDALFVMQDTPESVALGTFVELQLKLAEQEQVLKIPFTALYGLDRIYKIESGYMKSAAVTRTGELQDNNGSWLLVQSNELKEGDLIVTTQLPNAITGLRVEVAGDE